MTIPALWKYGIETAQFKADQKIFVRIRDLGFESVRAAREDRDIASKSHLLAKIIEGLFIEKESIV